MSENDKDTHHALGDLQARMKVVERNQRDIQSELKRRLDMFNKWLLALMAGMIAAVTDAPTVQPP